MEPTTIKQGEQFTDTAGRTGTVSYDTKTGQRLGAGQSTQVITPKDLEQVNPVVVPPAPTANGAPEVSASAGAVGDIQKAMQAEADKVLAEAKATKDSGRSKIEDLFAEQTTIEGQRGAVEAEQKIGEKSQRVTDITNQLEASQRAQTNELRALDGQGLTDVQKGQKSRELNRRYAFEQADLALIQSAANRDLVTAQSIADRKINLQLEPLKQQLEFSKFFYEENKDNLTKAEQRSFDLKIKDADRKYNEQKSALESLSKTKLDLMSSASQQEAPANILSAIQAAKTPEEAMRAAGKYGGDILERQIKQANLNKIYKETAQIGADGKIVVDQSGKVVLKQADAAKINKELVNSDAYKAIVKGKDALNYVVELENTLKRTGSTSQVFDPIKNTELKSKYNATTLILKEFFNLGVLNGPDLGQIQGIVPNPSDTSNFSKTVMLGTYQPGRSTQAGIDTMKKSIETTLDDRFATLQGQYGDYSGENVGAVRDMQRSYIQQKVQLNPDIAKLVQENPTLSYDEIISIMTE